MSDFKSSEIPTIAPEVTIDRDVAAQSRQQASGVVARGDDVHLRDDPEAKAAFLATFTADDEKRIMRKVDKRFVFLAGMMYLIKQVSSRACVKIGDWHGLQFRRRLIRTMPRMSALCTPVNPPTS